MSALDSPLARFVDRHTMTYERRYPHPIERVWEAVSTGEHLDVWLFPVTRVEQRVGGRATFTWGGREEDGVEVHEVTELSPPTAITFASTEWPGAWMRFALSADGADATLLSFTLHWPTPDGADSPFAPEHLSGFHGMLDNLAGFLAGTWSAADMTALIAQLTSGGPPDPLHVELIERYRSHVAASRPPAPSA
jgi:uncharacterized protein YndB with AHSA1/START domain